MSLDCPRALTEPPTCTGPQQTGWLRFSVHVDYDVNATDVECVEKTCPCELTSEEWTALEDEAVARAHEPPEEDEPWDEQHDRPTRAAICG